MAGVAVVLIVALGLWGAYLYVNRSSPPQVRLHPRPVVTTNLEIAAPVPGRLAPIWAGDFEQGNLSQWSAVNAVPGRIQPVRRPVRQGDWAARFEIRPGDVVSHGQRAELVYLSNEAIGDESWWGWSVDFPRTFRPGAWTIFTQWHDQPFGRNAPPVTFEVVKGSIVLSVRGGDPDTAKPATWNLGKVERDHWYDFVFHVRWSTEPRAGFVELWLNGKKVVPKTQLATSYFGRVNYLKIGNYRSPGNTTSVLYADAVKRGTSFSIVSDR